MALSLIVEGERWRAHLRTVSAAQPGLVPVAKGNGYGFGVGRLARRADWLGVDTMAVGSYEEAPAVTSRFGGDVLVMTPWRPYRRDLPLDRRILHTVGRVEDVAALARDHPGARVVVEGITAMGRHGMKQHELAAAARALGELRLEGFALHLPMTGDRLGEAEQWCEALEASQLGTAAVFVSHLLAEELVSLRERRPGITLRPRVGTGLWLGDRSALRAVATVLDAHQVGRGERVGYRQRAMPRDGTLLVVAGGTAHGIGLEAPTAATTLRQRATSFAKGGLEAAGFALSPYTVGGRQRWFAEPPHMQVSLLFVPRGVQVPAVGAEIDVDVRFTTTTFDAVRIS